MEESRTIQIIHTPTDTVLAEGPQGWHGIYSLSGNLYIPKAYLKGFYFRPNFILGCGWSRLLFIWCNLVIDKTHQTSFIGWQVILPNPLFWFTWFQIGIDPTHPELSIKALS